METHGTHLILHLEALHVFDDGIVDQVNIPVRVYKLPSMEAWNRFSTRNPQVELEKKGKETSARGSSTNAGALTAVRQRLIILLTGKSEVWLVPGAASC